MRSLRTALLSLAPWVGCGVVWAVLESYGLLISTGRDVPRALLLYGLIQYGMLSLVLGVGSSAVGAMAALLMRRTSPEDRGRWVGTQAVVAAASWIAFAMVTTLARIFRDAMQPRLLAAYGAMILGCVVFLLALGIFLPMWDMIKLFKG